jgi:hypothetical protein
MNRRIAIPAITALFVISALAILVTSSDLYEERSSDLPAITQVPDHGVPVVTSTDKASVDAVVATDEPEEEAPGFPDQLPGISSSADSADEVYDPFFVSEEDWIRVGTFFLGHCQRNSGDWVSYLESELARSDEELNSRHLEELAASAVLLDPGYTYNPPLTVEHLKPECRNLVCKVQIPNHVSVKRESSAIQLIPGSRLNTQGRVFFTHGFGYRLVLNQRVQNTTTHYFLANGYKCED